MNNSLNQDYLKAKYEEYCNKPVGIHQRAHEYKKLWNEDTSVLGFLLVETGTDDMNQSESLSLKGLRDAIQVIISERLADRQEQLVIKLDSAARWLTYVGIAIAFVGTLGTLASIFI